MIDSQTKQRILDAANILEVVSDFVSLLRSGVSYVGLCPFHNDRKPSFYVSPSKNVCKCFSCGEGGSPVHFLMKHEQMSYGDALRYLAKKYHIEIVEREETDEEKAAASERQSLFIINEYAQGFFRRQLLETEEGRHIGLSYFLERGIRPETIEKFGLGYSPELRTALTDEAVKQGFALERLIKVGLSVAYEDSNRPPIDRFRGRVIFPVRNLSGQYVAFGGRVMSKTDKTAKYVNSPESSIYSKSRELYGLYQAKGAIAKAGKCYLVEGYTDVLSMHQAGIENVVSSSGTALTQGQIRLLRRFSEHVTVLYDGDSAGIKAALKGIDLLLEEGLNIKVVLLPEGEDPDSYARSHTSEEFVRFLAEHEVDFISFKIELYRDDMQRDPIRRAELITDILRSIALIPDTIRRTVLIQTSAGELRMDEGLLSREVNRLRSQGVRASSDYITPPSQAPLLQTAQPSVMVPSPSRVEPPQEEPSTSAYTPHSYELSLIRLLIQHGHEPMSIYDEDEHGATLLRDGQVATYVYSELFDDGVLDSLSLVCQDVLREASQHCIPEGIDCSSFFTNHDSEAIRRMASDLLSSQIQQGETKEEDAMEIMLMNDVANASSPERQSYAIRELEQYRQRREQRVLLERGSLVLRELDSVRMALILRNINDIQKELRQAQQSNDTELILRLVQELQEMNQLKREFAQSLGERTIIG